jgi:3-methylcrotonyl-CoA carboxylase alpha subunit
MRKISRVLIANRGEIACRIIRTLRKKQITSIAIYAADEKDALHVRMADEAVLLTGESLQETYLNPALIVELAREYDADAIHPGYGFLSENAEFAEKCAALGIVFLGPEADVIRFMGNKIASRRLAASLGIPVLPSATGNIAQLIEASGTLKFPLLIKAASGGGGKGMQLVDTPGQLLPAMEKSSREAKSWFGDGSIYLEEYIDDAKHIEVQVFGDGNGEVIHLFERECSMQRRYQKLIEESPSPSIDEEQRFTLLGMAVRLAASKKYRSSGTVEFLLTPDGKFFFLEMNTRIQVEHPVTEEVTGIDLVNLQLELAETGVIPIRQEDVKILGHAIEARVYAEDPEAGFIPSPGYISFLRLPVPGRLRVESAFDGPASMPHQYDHLITKLISFGQTREESTSCLSQGLQELSLLGVHSSKDYLDFLLQQDPFISGKYTTLTAGLLTDFYKKDIISRRSLIPAELPPIVWIATLDWQKNSLRGSFHQARLKINGNSLQVYWDYLGNELSVEIDGNLYKPLVTEENGKLWIRQKEKMYSCICAANIEEFVDLDINGVTFRLNRDYESVGKGRSADESDGGDFIEIIAPLHGRVVKVNYSAGDCVGKEDVIIVIETMKMENNIHAGIKAEISAINIEEGTQVAKGQRLCSIRKIN